MATDTFKTKVVPIMDKVRNTLNSKKADEIQAKQNSMAYLSAGAVGPDGGMTCMTAQLNTLNYTGQWNSKTVEDYINMVKKELERQHIKVDAVMEKQMVDYMIKQDMPKSTTEYILRKAAESTIFYLDKRVQTTPMEDHIKKEGERRYNPSFAEDLVGELLGWAGNAGTTMGLGGFWGQSALDGVSMGVDAAAKGQEEDYLKQQQAKAQAEITAASKKAVTTPKWMFQQMGFEDVSTASDQQLHTACKWATANAQLYLDKIESAIDAGSRVVKANGTKREMSITDAYLREREYESFFKAISKEQEHRMAAKKTEQQATNNNNIAEEDTTNQSKEYINPTTVAETNANTGEYNGWNNLLGSMGLEGIGDTVNHLGVTLAMLPDMLVGILTGKTKSIGLNKSTMFPLVAILSGAFIKNPMLKIPLMLWGGANLVNKMGQEGLSQYRQHSNGSMSQQQGVQFKRYDDEQLNARIKDVRIEGNVIVMDIDNVPRVITLPDNAVAAYQTGALPLNTLANAILAKSDQMSNSQLVGEKESQDVSRHYEQKQEREQIRGIR